MGEHRPVLLSEAVEALALRADGIYIDATFGRGGHSRAILSALGPQGRLVALDRDPQAVAEGQAIADPRFSIFHAPFSQLGEVLDESGIALVNGALFDLGVSSPQIDEAERGFSFRMDGPLDMRMDPTRGESAAQWLARADESDIRGVIKDYGEERFAKQIARAIVAARSQEPIVTTIRLSEIVASAVRACSHKRENKQNPATRTFQAIRIHLNQELEELSMTLPQCVEMLKPGGRLVAISFHSLEDRIVKRFIREAADPDKLPRGVPFRTQEVQRLTCQRLRLIGKAIRPTEVEVAKNPRARSAVMRVAERVALA